MARYIDKDALIKQFECYGGVFLYGQDGVKAIVSRIKMQPTADVEKVCKCEKCKHLTIHNSSTLYAYCEKTHYEFKPFETDTRTHFCSFGEKKE